MEQTPRKSLAMLGEPARGVGARGAGHGASDRGSGRRWGPAVRERSATISRAVADLTAASGREAKCGLAAPLCRVAPRRSLSHLLGEQEVGVSNPPAPTRSNFSSPSWPRRWDTVCANRTSPSKGGGKQAPPRERVGEARRR